MRIKYNHKWLGWLSRDYFWGLTIHPYILFRDSKPEVCPWQVRHEVAHWNQQAAIGLLMYSVRYLLEFMNNYHSGMSLEQSYRQISFEILARASEKIT